MPTNIAYPMEVVDGRLVTSTDLANIADQINNVLDTRFGERVMRPEFGIKDYVFSVGSQVTAISDIERNLQTWIPNPPIAVSIANLEEFPEKSLVLNVEVTQNGGTSVVSSLIL